MRSKIFFWNFVGSLMSIINRLYSARYHRTHRIFNESEKQKMVIWLKINFPRDTRRRLAVNNLWMQCDVSCREDIINVSNEASPMGIGSTMKRIVE